MPIYLLELTGTKKMLSTSRKPFKQQQQQKQQQKHINTVVQKNQQVWCEIC